jgi:hypothetical protein
VNSCRVTLNSSGPLFQLIFVLALSLLISSLFVDSVVVTRPSHSIPIPAQTPPQSSPETPGYSPHQDTDYQRRSPTQSLRPRSLRRVYPHRLVHRPPRHVLVQRRHASLLRLTRYNRLMIAKRSLAEGRIGENGVYSGRGCNGFEDLRGEEYLAVGMVGCW